MQTCVLYPLKCQHLGWYRRGHCRGLLSATGKLAAQLLCNSRLLVLLRLHGTMPLTAKQRLWFQHGGTSSHCGEDVRQCLSATYPGRWIGRGGQYHGFGRRIYLRPAFYVLGHLKEHLHSPCKDRRRSHGKISDSLTKFMSKHQGAHEQMPCGARPSALKWKKATSDTWNCNYETPME